MRLERSSSFLKTLHTHSKLLNEIALREHHRLEKGDLEQLIISIYGYNEEQCQGLVQYFIDTTPEQMLIFDSPFYILEKRLAELFRWLSKNVRLRSHHSLSGIIAEITDATNNINESMEKNLDHSKFRIQSAIDTIEYRTNELIRISEENSEHISDTIQQFKEGVIESNRRAFLAQIILSEHLNPMLELIRPEGTIEIAFSNAKNGLEKIQSLYALPTDLRQSAERVVQKQRRAREKLQEIHQFSFTNFVPILQSYIRQTSTLLSGATSGIRAINTYGWKSIPPLRQLNLLRGKKSLNLIPDVGFKKYSLRQSTSQEIHMFTPGTPTIFVQDLELEDILPLLERTKIDDLLSEVLNCFPDYSLSDCNRVATDAIVSVEYWAKLSFLEKKTYSRNEEKLEVRRVAIL